MSLRNVSASATNGTGAHPKIDACSVNADERRNFRGTAKLDNNRRCGFHASVCSDWRYDVKPSCCEHSNSGALRCALQSEMLSVWAKQAIDFAGISQAELARQVSDKIRRQIDRAAMNKILKGTRELAGDEMLAIAEITGFSAPSSLRNTRMVVVVGYAAAGADSVTFADGQGPFDEVEAPSWANETTVAVRVRGTSLGLYFDGWLAFYDNRRDPPDAALVGALCVCGLSRGRVVIKKLRAGSAKGLFHLESETEPTLFDERVEWAAEVKEMRPR
jgi:hypothetical protein